MAYIGAGITRFNTADELTVTGTSEFGGNVSFGDNNITNVGSLQIDSIAGDADTNTNITFAGSDVITMTTAGSERLRITSAGSVGIGTTSPGGKLAIFDSTSATFRLETPGVVAISHSFDGTDYTINNNDGSSGHNIIFGSKTAGAESMRIDSSGRVGIGTSSPSASLGAGGLHVTDRIAVGTGSAGTPALHPYTDTDTGLFFGTGVIAFGTGGNERLRIDSSGNVGIGISAPSAGLHIDNPNNGAITAILDTDNSAVKMVFRNNTETGNNVQIGADGSNLVSLTNGSERLRIDSSGNVGIGTVSPAAIFNISEGSGYHFTVAGGNATSGMQIGNYDGSSYSPVTVRGSYTRMDVSGTERARFTSNGLTFNGDTAAANALDSYEEGTWTPAVANGTVTVGNNRYTKIGNIVNLRCQLSNFSDRSSSAAITISGLPFGSGSASSTAGVVLGRYNDAGDGPIVANIGNSASIMNLYGMSDGGNWTGINHFHLNNAAATFLINITYSVS